MGLALSAALVCSLASAQSATDTKTFENSDYRFSVTLPSGCRHDEGPGTLDAICSIELDPAKSAKTSAASALVLEVGVERVPDDANKPVPELVQRYGEEQFKAELPEAICGESDGTRVKTENAKQVLEGDRVAYTADVTCPEIKFLGLGERRAMVQVLITAGMRYRLMARAPKDEFEQRKSTVDAFFASFRILP